MSIRILRNRLFDRDGAEAVLRGCTFVHSTGAAVRVKHGAAPSLHLCTFERCETGVALEAGARGAVSDNTFSPKQGAVGVHISGAGVSTEVRGNRLTGNRTGMLLTAASGSMVRENFFEEHEDQAVLRRAAPQRD